MSKRPLTWLGIDNCLEFAHRALSEPVARPFIERPPEPAGELVWECVLPLHLCPSANPYSRLLGWQKQRLKDEAIKLMLAQNGGKRRAEPLPGRPTVHCVRFSSASPDAHSAWSKNPVDRLVVRGGGLGFLVDDRPAKVNLRCWWEPAPRGSGFTLVRVFRDGGAE